MHYQNGVWNCDILACTKVANCHNVLFQYTEQSFRLLHHTCMHVDKYMHEGVVLP